MRIQCANSSVRSTLSTFVSVMIIRSKSLSATTFAERTHQNSWPWSLLFYAPPMTGKNEKDKKQNINKTYAARRYLPRREAFSEGTVTYPSLVILYVRPGPLISVGLKNKLTLIRGRFNRQGGDASLRADGLYGNVERNKILSSFFYRV